MTTQRFGHTINPVCVGACCFQDCAVSHFEMAKGSPMSRTTLLNVYLCTFTSVIYLSISAYAQIGQASLQGLVADSSGGVIPGAIVSLKNKGTEAVRAVTTDAAGHYFVSDLNPAEYSFTVSFKGFKTYVVSSVILHTGEHATLDGTLEVGESNQEVTVGAAAPLVTTTSAEVSQLVAPSQVAELPLNGRNFWELTQLTPGATFIPRAQTSQYNGSEIRARNVNVTVNGQGYIFTGWSLNGANVTNFELGGTLIVPNVDAIQEFNVLSGDMAPEYGHTPNMVVSSLKGGTNSFHGDAFDYIRNNDLDARNFFLAAREPLKRNQGGGTLGGPIKKDKVFFFADFQGTWLRQGTPYNYVVPSLAQRNGDFSASSSAIKDPMNNYSPFPGNMIPASRMSSQGSWFVPYIPSPNLQQGSTYRYSYSANLPLDQNVGDLRMDANLTNKDTFMASYSVSSNTEINPNPFPAVPSTNLHSKAQDWTARWTHIFGPTLLNVVQAANYDSPFIFSAVGPGVDVNGMAGIQGFSDTSVVPQQSWPTISISGFQGFQGSPSDQRPKYIRVRHVEFSDTMTYNRGSHELKFGAEEMHRNDGFHIGQNDVGNWSFLGTYSGNAFADFLLGQPDNGTRSSIQLLQGDYDDFKALHFNDTWHVRSNLTLTLGVRWEINPFMKGINYSRTGFDPANGDIIVPTGLQLNPQVQPLTGTMLKLFADRIEYTSQVGLPASVSPSDWKDIGPRVGIAWTPMPKTVVRSGFGIFYAYPDTNLLNNTVVTVPFVINSQVFNDRPPLAPTHTFGNFFAGAPIVAANPNPGQPCSFGMVLDSCNTPNMTSALVHLRQQYTQEWNLTVEREITPRVAMRVAYVGSRTVRLQQGQNENDPLPGPGAIQARRPFPQWGGIGLQSWGGEATYDGLQTSINTRDWHGLTLMGSYVRGKCLDTGSNEATPPGELLNGHLNYGPCDFDVENSGAISFNYALPLGPGHHFLPSGLAGRLIGGWQLGAVTTLQSGLPFTPTIGTDRANIGVTGQRPEVIGTPFTTGNIACWFYTSSNSSCTALFPNGSNAFAVPTQYTIGNGGRNILRGDMLAQLDISVLKDFVITEAKRVQFRSEFFNITNHPTFALPGTNIDQSSGGQVSSTLNSDRIIQFALKFFF